LNISLLKLHIKRYNIFYNTNCSYPITIRSNPYEHITWYHVIYITSCMFWSVCTYSREFYHSRIWPIR